MRALLRWTLRHWKGLVVLAFVGPLCVGSLAELGAEALLVLLPALGILSLATGLSNLLCRRGC